MSLTEAAKQNMEECGIDEAELRHDVWKVATGAASVYRLLADCLEGADADRVQGWRDYVKHVEEEAKKV